MRSLAEVGKTGLLNKGITVVTPEPAEVQAEASGRQYVTGRAAIKNVNQESATVESEDGPASDGGDQSTESGSGLRKTVRVVIG